MNDISKYLNDEIFWDWIYSHINDDPKELSLRFAHSSPWVDFAIVQIECRQKSSRKLNTTLNNSFFTFPTLLSAEQSTSDALARFHASLVPIGSSVLDMTCGLGIDCFHICRRANSVTAIDINPDIVKIANYNAKLLKISNLNLISCDSVDYVKQTDHHFDVIFVDPARRSSTNRRLFALADCQPNIVSLLPLLMEIADRIIIKMSPMLDATAVINELSNVSDIYAIGTPTECKELVAVIDSSQSESSDVQRHAVTIAATGDLSDFSFSENEEITSTPTMLAETPAKFLYVPSPSVAKLMPYRLLSARFSLEKLGPNTHLYHSTSIVTDFPGARYAIIETLSFDKATIKSFATKYPKINISTRSFPLSPDELRKRLKTKDGGSLFLFACTLADSSKVLIVAEKQT